jgi:hypothetical protein
MKKSTISLLAIFFILANITAVYSQQYVNYGSTTKEIQNIAKNDIYVILTGNKIFDNALLTSVQTYWKLSKTVKTVKSGDVEDILKNQNNYFIGAVEFFNGLGNTMELLNAKAVQPEAEIKKLQDKNLVFFNGKSSQILKFNFRTVIASVPFMVNNTDNYLSMLDYMVKGLNDGVESVIKNNMVGAAVNQGVYTEARKNAGLLKNKTLLAEQLKVADFKRYTGKYEIKTAVEISKLLADGSKDYCVLTYSINNTAGCKSLYVYDLETKSIIYALYVANALDPSVDDMAKISNAMAGK